jgi:RNA polymerase sigma-70 factor (ECF subfamily)
MGFGAGSIAELYVHEYARLKRIVSRILNRPEAAEDVIQDTFVKLSDRALTVSDRGLVVRAAQNMARDYNRNDRIRAALPENLRNGHLVGAPASPEQEAVARDGLQALLEAIRSLPRRRAQIFLLAKLDGMPYARIAEELGVSLSTVEKEMAAAIAFCHKWQRDHDFL